ncbi:MAG: carcinine hydrolase/isopenicillin-N N-acyltransferase family protein [candidate division FCPU426 bacterium]
MKTVRTQPALPIGRQPRRPLFWHLLWLLPGWVAAVWVISDCLLLPPLPARALAPPALTSDPSGRISLGPCYAFRRGPLTACYLEGEPELRGWALARFFPQTQDNLLPAHPLAPGWLQWRWLAWRHLSSLLNVPEEVQREVAGQIQAGLGPRSRARALVSQFDYDLIPRGAVATSPSAVGCVLAGHTQQPLWLAMAWEWPEGREWDERKAVVLFNPAVGRRFLCLLRPGQWGTLAGINEAGVGVCVLPGLKAGRANGGLAAGMLARRVLAETSRLDEAVDLIQRTPVLAPQTFLVGCGSENRAVAVEKGPEQTVVRPLSQRMILATQAFQSFDSTSRVKTPGKDLQNAPGGGKEPRIFVREALRAQGNGGTLPRSARLRLKRLEYLLATTDRPVDAPVLAGILRDRQAVYGGRLGLGNRSAVNSLTAVQAVMLDLSRGRLWVAAAPHQLGSFVPFDLDSFATAPAEPPVPEDRLLPNGGYAKYLAYLQGKQAAEQMLRRGRLRDALMHLQEIQPLNPLDYQAHLLAARALRRMGRMDEARYNYTQAKRLQPAYGFEALEIETALKDLAPAQP